MIKLISKVLEQYSDTNLNSETGRLTIAKEIIKEMKEDTTGWFLDLSMKRPFIKNTYRPYSKEVTDA
jgi:hypothetical protein